MMSVDISPSQGGKKVVDYDGSLSSAIGDIWNPGSALASAQANWKMKGYPDGGLQAALLKTSTNTWSLAGKTTGAWGTPLTLSFTGTLKTSSEPILEIFKSGATYIAAVLYIDNSNVLRCNTYTFSGTTPTLVVNGDQIVASVNSDMYNDKDLVRESALRGIAKYINTSGYHTVIGITFSTTAATEDAAAAIVKSTANGGTADIRSAMAATKSNGADILFKTTASADWQISEIADAGTSLSVSGEQAALLNITNAFCASAAANTLSMVVVNDGVQVNVIEVDTVDGGVADLIAATGSSERPSLSYATQDAAAMRNHPICLGDVDGDGIQWFVFAANSKINGNVLLQFVGAIPGREPDEFIQVSKFIATGQTDYEAGSLKLAFISSSSFLAGWIDNGTDRYKYMQVNL